MTLAPRSLLARTFLLIGLVLVLAMLAWSAIFRVFEYEPRALQAARMIVSVVNLTRSALVTAKPELRRDLLRDISEQEGIRIYPAERDDRLDPLPVSPFLSRTVELVRAALGDETRFGLAREAVPALWVSFRIDEDEYWIAMDAERINRPLTLQLLGWGVLALMLALLGAFLIVYRLRTPLTALARAAREIGQGKHPEPLPERGPDELKTLAAAFNQMSSDLARLDADRALILAGVSHDLRTPLTRLRLGIEMSGADAQTRAEMAGDIDEMDGIIGQFLDFARTDGGEPCTAVDTAALAREIVLQYRERGREIEAEIGATPTAPLRPLALRRLITNLLDNAFRYAGRGVTLRTATQGGAIVIEVLDRGPGIPAAERERMKQPFQRLEAARTNLGGSGLGLAIVERIAQAHHGRLDLLPRSGGGLVARVVLRGDATR